LNFVSTIFLVHTSQIDGDTFLRIFEFFSKVFFYNRKKNFWEKNFAEFSDNLKKSKKKCLYFQYDQNLIIRY
jgi:hypothetical protein